MLCLTIENFVFCWPLEMSGYVLGWLSAIGFGFTYCFLAAYASYGLFLSGVIQPNENMWEEIYESNFTIKLKAQK